MTSDERRRAMLQCAATIAKCAAQIVDFLNAEATDRPSTSPRKARRPPVPEPTATPRGIAIARQEIDRHIRKAP